jgi:hypothetical protein
MWVTAITAKWHTQRRRDLHFEFVMTGAYTLSIDSSIVFPFGYTYADLASGRRLHIVTQYGDATLVGPAGAGAAYRAAWPEIFSS